MNRQLGYLDAKKPGLRERMTIVWKTTINVHDSDREKANIKVLDLSSSTISSAGKCVAQLEHGIFFLFVFAAIQTLEAVLLQGFDYSIGVRIDWSAYGE